MKAKLSVTIEFPMKHPITWTGEQEASNIGVILNRGVKAAMKANKGKTRGWSSLVAVILERDDVDTPDVPVVESVDVEVN
jgi:hypothetical protein